MREALRGPYELPEDLGCSGSYPRCNASYISPFISPLSPCTGPQHCSARGPPPAPSGGNGRDHPRVAVPERWWRPLRRRAQSKDERGLRTRWNTQCCAVWPFQSVPQFRRHSTCIYSSTQPYRNRAFCPTCRQPTYRERTERLHHTDHLSYIFYLSFIPSSAAHE